MSYCYGVTWKEQIAWEISIRTARKTSARVVSSLV